MTPVVPVGFSFGIDACRAGDANSLLDVLWSQSPGDDRWDAHAFDNAPIQFPAMCHAQGPDLAIAEFVAIEKKPICDSVVGTSEGNAAFINDRNASHERDFRELGFKCLQLRWRNVLRRRAKMHNLWQKRCGEPRDEVQIVRKGQRGRL